MDVTVHQQDRRQRRGRYRVYLFFAKSEPTRDLWFCENQVPAGQKAYSMTTPIRLERFQGCVDCWGGPDRAGRQETEQAWRVDLDATKAPDAVPRLRRVCISHRIKKVSRHE